MQAVGCDLAHIGIVIAKAGLQMHACRCLSGQAEGVAGIGAHARIGGNLRV